MHTRPRVEALEAREVPAVTVVVEARVKEPSRPPMNSLEVLEVKLFAPDALPSPIAHHMGDMVTRALTGQTHWE